MSTRKTTVSYTLALAGLAAAVGFWAGTTIDRSSAQDNKGSQAPADKSYTTTDTSPLFLKQSPGAKAANHEANDYGLGDGHVSKLKPYPQLKAGQRTPFDLWLYAGKCGPSWKAPVLDMPWDEWV